MIRSICYRMLLGGKVDYNEFDSIIDFVRKYADRHHHERSETARHARETYIPILEQLEARWATDASRDSSLNDTGAPANMKMHHSC
ncbi:MAG: hypothetical protein N2376_01735 [Clostridia bacterium]|nr:hypothetical protein [Clostridia bacterium]